MDKGRVSSILSGGKVGRGSYSGINKDTEIQDVIMWKTSVLHIEGTHNSVGNFEQPYVSNSKTKQLLELINMNQCMDKMGNATKHRE